MQLSRRTVLGGAACIGSTWKSAFAQELVPATTPPSSVQALARLQDGNKRFAAGQVAQRDKSEERRLILAKAQSPFAAILCCSDSRVPPELLFGQGLGELFVVRNAGNTIDTAAMGSLEYAVSALRVPLVVVLGHENCGAVAAAISLVEDGKSYSGAIGRMIEPILPAVLAAKKAGFADLLDASVEQNVRRIVKQLREGTEPTLMQPLAGGTLKIVGATYSLGRGEVDFFDVA